MVGLAEAVFAVSAMLMVDLPSVILCSTKQLPRSVTAASHALQAAHRDSCVHAPEFVASIVKKRECVNIPSARLRHRLHEVRQKNELRLS